MLVLVFLLVAAILAALAAIGVPGGRVNLLAAALLFFILAQLWPLAAAAR